MNDSIWKLILVTNQLNASLEDYLDFVMTCVEAGVTSLQLREKNRPYSDVLNLGKSLKQRLDSLHIPLIINDNLDLCLELDAAGVHLGQSDGDIVTARAKLGPHKIIGLSVNTPAQVACANHLPVNYIGIGAIFPTQNKPDVETLWGLSGLKRAAAISAHPIVAIGGIEENNAHEVMHCGASGIAAIGAFHNAPHPRSATRNLRKIVERGLSYERDDRKN